MVKSILKEEGKDNVLLLDSGGAFLPGNRVAIIEKAELVDKISLEAMKEMGYAAMVPGPNELSLGPEFLKDTASDIRFPLVTSNLLYRDSRLPFGKKYIIKRVGGLRMAILGIVPLDLFDRVKGKESLLHTLEIISPNKALKDLLPVVRDKADLVILLSQCNFEDTAILADGAGGIDIAICHRSGMLKSPLKDIRTPILTYTELGRQLGFLKLKIDDLGQVELGVNKKITLSDSIEDDERIAIMLAGFEVDVKRMSHEAMSQEAKELWKLTPEEYIRMLQKKQAETGARKK